jgi:hypothetical protein
MPLFRTPLVDKDTPVVILDGPNAGCVTPYFQRTLLNITSGADSGAAASVNFAPLISGKVDKNGSSGWAAASGTASKATFATYTSPSVDATYNQAEVQAIADHIQILSQHIKAIEDGLLTAAVFSS